VATTWLRILAAGAVVGAIMTMSGAFGSGVLKVAPRFAYWLAQIAAGVTLGVAIGMWLVPRDWYDRRPWLAWGVIVLALWGPMTAMVILANILVACETFRWGLLAHVAPSTLATTAAMTALAFLVRDRAPGETHAAPAGRLRPASSPACRRSSPAPACGRWRRRTTTCACTPRRART
jgi:hypothetical protein